MQLILTIRAITAKISDKRPNLKSMDGNLNGLELPSQLFCSCKIFIAESALSLPSLFADTVCLLPFLQLRSQVAAAKGTFEAASTDLGLQTYA